LHTTPPERDWLVDLCTVPPLMIGSQGEAYEDMMVRRMLGRPIRLLLPCVAAICCCARACCNGELRRCSRQTVLDVHVQRGNMLCRAAAANITFGARCTPGVQAVVAAATGDKQVVVLAPHGDAHAPSSAADLRANVAQWCEFAASLALPAAQRGVVLGQVRIEPDRGFSEVIFVAPC
jgi:hypothetical protein